MTREIKISAAQRLGSCPHFWQAAGCDEAYDWTLHPTGEALLEEIRQTGCIKWLRNHHVFSRPFLFPDGRRVFTYNEDAQGRPYYDFSGIEAVYDRWLAAGIRPVVELDFLPEQLRDERKLPLNTPDMWEKWRGLLRAFVTHLQQRYGVEETRQWYFEIWNEPDLWPRERLQELFRLQDEAVAAIEDVDSQLRIGGPATAAQPMCDTWLQQVHFGRNQVTGKTGSRYDYISMHQYGVSGNTLLYYPAMVPKAQNVVMASYWLYELLKVFPGAREKEFHFNEWGMISHYEKTAYEFPPLEIRNSEFFPLFMMKLVHLLFTLSDFRGNWLPSMLLLWAGAAEPYWAAVPELKQRIFGSRSGLFAGNRSLTTLYNLPKPILRGFQLLAGLGSERLLVEGARCGETPAVLATHGDGAIQILAYHFDEEVTPRDGDVELACCVSDLPDAQTATFVVTRLDRRHANSYRAWEALGRPEELSLDQLAAVREAGLLCPEPARSVKVEDGAALFNLTLPAHGAALISLRVEGSEIPAPVRQAENAKVSWVMA